MYKPIVMIDGVDEADPPAHPRQVWHQIVSPACITKMSPDEHPRLQSLNLAGSFLLFLLGIAAVMILIFKKLFFQSDVEHYSKLHIDLPWTSKT